MRLILFCLLLTACAAPPTVLQPVKPPANALTKCPDLLLPDEGEAIEPYLAYVIDEFYRCAIRHDALVDFSIK